MKQYLSTYASFPSFIKGNNQHLIYRAEPERARARERDRPTVARGKNICPVIFRLYVTRLNCQVIYGTSKYLFIYSVSHNVSGFNLRNPRSESYLHIFKQFPRQEPVYRYPTRVCVCVCVCV